MATNVGCAPNCLPVSGFSIEAGYPTFDVTPNEIRATLVGYVPWLDLNSFVASIFPPSTIVSGTLYQYLGQQLPGWNNLRATKLKILPVNPGDITDNAVPPIYPVSDYTGTTIKMPVYNHAKVELTYENVKNQPTNPNDPVPYLTHRWSVGGQIIALNEGGSCWDKLLYKFDETGAASSLPVDASGPVARNWIGREAKLDECRSHILLTQIEHEVKWSRVIRPPVTAIRNCMNKVNTAPLTLVTGVVPVECMHLSGAQLQTQVLTDGTYAMELVYRFSEQQVYAMDQTAVGGWNHFFYQGGSDRITVGGSGAYSGQYCRYTPAGFYRLERQFVRPQSHDDCNVFEAGGEKIDLITGYQQLTAIYPKADFSALFRPEP